MQIPPFALFFYTMSDTSASFPYVERDLSWMFFNHRILAEARRPEVPLLERLSFLGIYSNNLDEFFRVRVATLARLAELKGKDMRDERHNARRQLGEITALDSQLSQQFADTIADVTNELHKNGIHFVNEKDLDDEQAHYVRCLFRNKISGFVSPVWLRHLSGFAQESDDHIYLAVVLDGPGIKRDYAVIELPSAVCGRFVCLPARDDQHFVMYLDDVIRACLPMIFPGMGYTDFKAYSFKFTKDAEMELDNDLNNGTIEKIAKGVKSRKRGAALRVLHDADMPAELLDMLMRKLRLDVLDTVQPTGRYQNHKDLMSFPAKARPDLRYQAWPPLVKPELKGTDSLMQLVSEHDRYIHVPYHTFDYVIRLLQEAAVSKNVKGIKITLYRLAKNSKIVEALICAARNGKRVTAVIELLARFDESSNIHYAKQLRDAGVNVVFGVEGLKIHSKLALIQLKNGRDIAIIGTGNFHEGNAKVYTDYFLMTAKPALVREAAQVFDIIKRPYNIPRFKHLIVPPFNMRERFIELIDNEIKAARKGKPAWIKIKINHITDREMVAKLYEASQAGVQIDLLVRGNCSLVTGVKGVSENIRIAGIIDRYLEHSRIFVFHAGGKNLTFLGSADWLPRNLDRRIEVITPVYDPELKADLLNTIDYGLLDNTNATIVDGSGTTRLRTDTGADGPFRSQEQLYNHYK